MGLLWVEISDRPDHPPIGSVHFIVSWVVASMEKRFLDSSVLQAARQIYESHVQLRSNVSIQSPRGVVIHPHTLRGDLIFSEYPILLPHEMFIPIDVLDTQLEAVA